MIKEVFAYIVQVLIESYKKNAGWRNIKTWMKNWEMWRECILAVTIILIIYKLIDNAYPIWREFQHFLSVIRPFVIGFVIAYFLNGPCNKVEAKFGRRGLSVLIVYVLVICLIGIIVSFIIPIIVINIVEFVSNVPLYMAYFTDNLDENRWLIAFVMDAVSDTVMSLISIKEILNQLGSGLNSIGEYARMMTTGIFHMFLSVIISIYVLLYKDKMLVVLDRVAKIFIKERQLRAVTRYLHKSNEIFYKFISCQFIDACIVGTIAVIGLSLIGVEYAVTLGLILGICNMIPYFGSIFASVVTVVITAFTGGFTLALIAGVFLLILQQIDGNIIGPRLMGGALDLNPILIILAITIGGAYFGIIGMFISVPLAAIVKILINNAIDSQEKKIN